VTQSVTEIVVARGQEPGGLQTMLAYSVAAHVALVLAIVFMPDSWRRSDPPPRTVMTISLGGAPGPRSGGMTTTGGRTVQAPAPPAERRVETPPAPKPAPMALPTQRPRPQPARPQRAPENATSRTPSTGPQPQEGNTRTDTGARGQGFGLTTGGGAGSNVQLDVGNFCCPEYLQQMITLIHRNWDSKHNVTGTTTMRFTITRQGAIERVEVERPSGFYLLDNAAQRALLLTRLPELPPQFPNPTLTVHMIFEYSR
jgi:protein TonB